MYRLWSMEYRVWIWISWTDRVKLSINIWSFAYYVIAYYLLWIAAPVGIRQTKAYESPTKEIKSENVIAMTSIICGNIIIINCICVNCWQSTFIFNNNLMIRSVTCVWESESIAVNLNIYYNASFLVFFSIDMVNDTINIFFSPLDFFSIRLILILFGTLNIWL